MIEYSIDANIFFRIFKETDATLKNFVESLEFVIDSIVYIECIQGSKSNLEKQEIKNYLNNFPLLPVTSETSKRAIELIDIYSNSHGLLLADSMIAATALENDLTIVTYNIDDFKFIQGLKYLKPII